MKVAKLLRRWTVRVGLSLFLCLGEAAWAEEPVHFDDAHLKAAVEAALHVTNPTPTQMLGLTTLLAEGKGIVDLTGLEYATHLTSLDLDENQISDLAPLAGLTGLQRLYLEANQISSISPLAGLVNLTNLDLDENQISAISVLAGLPNLADLDLDTNLLTNLGPLAGLTHLTFLDVANNQVSDLSPVAHLTQLTWFDACDNQISNLAPLAGLANLRELRLSANQISDVSVLADLTQLQSVWLFDNRIRTLPSLAALTHLRDLRLYDNQVQDISSLAGLTSLQDVWLHNNAISDLAPLASLTGLARVYLGNNQVSDAAPLAGLLGLTRLDLRQNPLNGEACTVYIPQILANNPGIDLDYDPCLGACMLTISATAYGSVTDPGEGPFGYACGSVVAVAAVVDSGGTFTGWTGTAVNAGKVKDPSSARTTVTVDGTYTLRANFEGGGEVPPYRLSVVAGPGGSVPVPGAGVFTYDRATTVTLAARPFTGYRFSGWTGTAVSAGKVANASAADTTVIVDGSYAVQAGFTREATHVTWYVDAAATGHSDGSSWEHAFVCLQDALARAAAGDRIWVAEGLYWPDLGGGQTAGHRAATFRLQKGVAIYGGFPTAGGAWEQRNPFLHQSILSGEIGKSNVAADNSYHVVTGSGTDKTALLEGFTITGGVANGVEPQDRGAGLYNLRGSPQIRNCIFLGNTATGNGGGACNLDSDAAFVNCVFNANTAGNCGGGLYHEQGSLTVINCTFFANQGLWRGGGIFNASGIAAATNCILWANGRMEGESYDELAQVSGEVKPVLDHCCVQRWTGSLGGSGNFGRDPLFADPDGLDGLAATPDDDLRLQPGSPCIDKGDHGALPPEVATDQQGGPRIIRNAVDMGAYEFGPMPRGSGQPPLPEVCRSEPTR